MDRRQRKTREAIFTAFIELLSKKDFAHITVEEIINAADIGRATFYSHFETKDSLLKELCEELFCHLFDSMGENKDGHKHIFECDPPESVFLHLIRHLQKNDNNISALLSCPNNDLFLQYFKRNLKKLVADQICLFETEKNSGLPRDFLINHITATFVETIKWWTENGMKESSETITGYFFSAVR